MRLWTLHPKYLDRQGLLALWREGLLARAVLHGQTRGYTRHPQLERFRSHASPVSAIDAYLAVVHDEATRRGYAFDRSKFADVGEMPRIDATAGQLDYEWQHLLRKLALRDGVLFERWQRVARPAGHPLFRVRPGPLAAWERTAPDVPWPPHDGDASRRRRRP